MRDATSFGLAVGVLETVFHSGMKVSSLRTLSHRSATIGFQEVDSTDPETVSGRSSVARSSGTHPNHSLHRTTAISATVQL